MTDIYNAEYITTFSPEGGIKRLKMLMQMFIKDPCVEMSIIIDTAEQVIHDKYGFSYSEIEQFERDFE